MCLKSNNLFLFVNLNLLHLTKNNEGVSQMQNLRYPQRGLADLGENRRIWGVRRTKVRRAPKSAIEKVRIYIENFEEIQPITVSFPKFRQVGLFFFFPRAFSISSNVTAPTDNP